METSTLTREELRQILRASEGIPSQISSARVLGGQVVPATVGHPISSHLQSAGLIAGKTTFHSLVKMVEALWQLLRTPTAQATLKNLAVGSRITVRADVNALFGFECELRDQWRYIRERSTTGSAA
jgi:hypothetical protein